MIVEGGTMYVKTCKGILCGNKLLLLINFTLPRSSSAMALLQNDHFGIMRFHKNDKKKKQSCLAYPDFRNFINDLDEN